MAGNWSIPTSADTDRANGRGLENSRKIHVKIGVAEVGIVKGLRCNLDGLRLALRTPKLLLLGLVRLAAMLLATGVGVWLALAYHAPLLERIWTRPESLWVIWIWYLVSWMVGILMAGLAAVLGYLVSQVLFAVFVMDMMSRHTEWIVTGREVPPPQMARLRWFAFLVAQEIPRTILPVLFSLVVLLGGWLTPMGPVLTVISSAAAAIFMAWDHTDLVPARRLEPFAVRFGRLKGSLGFHLGFGLWFLIPVVNLVFLSFAPVGGTLHALAVMDRGRPVDG